MAGPSFFRRTCLKPSYSLRQQLLLSFGLAALLTLAIVVSVAAITAYRAGLVVNGSADELFREQVSRRLVRNNRYVAETMAEYFKNMHRSIQLTTEFVQDRIVGYPDAGWEEDLHVPFRDRESGKNKYPLNSTRLPLDWEFIPNVNSENVKEHFPDREHMLESHPGIMASHPCYFTPGVCDPRETDPSSFKYYQNCSFENNALTSGGGWNPNPTNRGLYEKAADIGVFLKPIFEAQVDIEVASVVFVNSGASSLVQYPSTIVGGLSAPYVSEGCDWMREINPRNGKPYGTEDDIARCPPAGQTVIPREYNSNTRSWFPALVRYPDGVAWEGPLGTRVGIPLYVVGQGIFDRRTGNLIGAVVFAIEAETLIGILNSTFTTTAGDRADISIIRYVDNRVFVDTIESDMESQTVLDTGFISEKDLDQLRNRIPDFTKEWTPEEVQSSLRANIVVGETATYTAFPLPPPPTEFDPAYVPEYLVIRSISNDVFHVTTLNDDIENSIEEIFLLSFLVGAFGMLLTLMLIWLVSRCLTRPLLWIRQVGWSLVNHADESTGAQFLLPRDSGVIVSSCSCGPTTEITELVYEFNCMINGVSGNGTATLAQPDLFEIPNQLTWQSEYQQLYSYSAKSIDDKTVRLAFVEAGDASQEADTVPPDRDSATETDDTNVPTDLARVPTSIVLAPPKKNLGTNVATDYLFKTRLKVNSGFGPGRRAHRSSLFRWILFLIVFPLVATNIVICWIVGYRIQKVMDNFVDEVIDKSLQLENDVLQSSASLKAVEASIIMHGIVQNTFVLTRVAGWLFFGGINRSDSFSDIDQAAQECRGYSDDNVCPVFYDFERTPCFCSWNDLSMNRTDDRPCLSNNFTDSRSLQHTFFFCQARDADTATGRRVKAASFGSPGIDDSPAATLFWDDIDAVPGASKGSNASGYETTYDRIRVASAMSAVEIPVYNHDASNYWSTRHFVSASVAFDADGMMAGYRGCEPAHQTASTFQSTASNQAAVINPDLCPLGKFGLDPRCREWYATGKRLYNESQQPIYISAPYVGASLDLLSSVTSPIANPSTGEYVGQMLYSFAPGSMDAMFKSLEEPIAFLVTRDDGGTGHDTVVGPDRLGADEPNSILDLIFKFDKLGAINRRHFDKNILAEMKRGEQGKISFDRTTEHGTEETLVLAFRPVKARVMLPVDPSDFTRGVNRSENLLYSLGVAYREADIGRPWHSIENSVSGDLQRLQIIYICSMGLLSLLLLCYSCHIAMNVTKPLITLLHIVQCINSRKIEDDIPPLDGGSSEVRQVYNSFSKLYKTVRVSNIAFFNGNLAFARNVTNDALKLYRKIGDKKAVGIACNNLANIFHAMCSYGPCEDSNRLDGSLVQDCCDRSPDACSVRMAIALYDETISIAHFQLGLASSDEEKADFTQQLADRLFNRALFLLLVANEKCAPQNARAKALADIERVRDMDFDVKEFLVDRKILLQRSSDYFYRLLHRCMGLLEYYGDEDLRQIWDLNELVEDADRFLFAAWDHPTAPLFEQVTRIGRLQQLECVAMRLDICKGRQILAARLAMRMFAEDEYILEEAFAVSASVLLKLIRDDDDWPDGWTSKAKAVRADLRKMLLKCRATKLDLGKSLVFAVELSDKWRQHELLDVINARCLQLYDDCCMKDDYMGLVAYTTQGDLNVPIELKAENEGRQRTSLDLATSTTSEQVSPAFPHALQLLIDSNTAPENDTFVILLSDGKSYDPSTPETFKAQLALMNRNRETNLHVVILGLEVDEALKADYKLMCSLSKQSIYMDVNIKNVDRAFNEISAVIGGESTTGSCLRGVTMEKF